MLKCYRPNVCIVRVNDNDDDDDGDDDNFHVDDVNNDFLHRTKLF